MKTVTIVCYYWLPFGTVEFIKMLESFKKFPPGYPYRLLFILGGEKGMGDFLDIMRSSELYYSWKFHPEIEFDMQGYGVALRYIKTDYVFFFKSNTEFIHKDWLKIFMSKVNEDTGI